MSLATLLELLLAILQILLKKESLTANEKKKMNRCIYQFNQLKKQAVKLGCDPNGEE